MKKFFSFFSTRRGWSLFLFWSWNIIFLAFMGFGFAPTILPEMINAVEADTVPAAFLAYAAVLTAIPLAAIVLALTVFRREPLRLFSFGYVVEGPLMLLLAIRFFVVRQATTAVTLLLAAAAVGLLTYLWVMVDRRLDERTGWLSGPRLLGLTLLLLIGLYVSIWIAFYAVPLGSLAVENFDDFFRDIWRGLRQFSWSAIELRQVPFNVLGILLFLYSGTLFVLMPVVVSVLCVRAWLASLRLAARRLGMGWAIGIPLATLLFLMAGVWWTNRQPQHRAFDLLSEPPASAADVQQLLDQEEVIRAGLLNTFLAPQRYISSVGEVTHVSAMYRDTLGLDQATAARVQSAYEAVARPVLYQPIYPLPASQISWRNTALLNEPAEAAELYERFFDRPITEGEREVVVDAVRSTWSVDQATAGWQAVDEREIWLVEQQVTVSENGDWAEVELYEVYQNQTDRRQEVIYYFSLPESAVVTGVWLGTSADRSQRFAYRVAPRGAAQQVYQDQIQTNIDPALVEQIGPSQYRLRVYPVEPIAWDWDGDTGRSSLQDGPPLHMWLTYRAMAAGDGWPLPYLSQRLNVFWTADTRRIVNGAPMVVDGNAWLPAQAAASQPAAPQAHQVTFADGAVVTARPETAADRAAPGGNLALAVVIDRSRSMVLLADEVAAALGEIDAWGSADVYLTSSEFRGEPPLRTTIDQLDPAGIVYFGGQNPGDLLSQFGALYQGEPYDAVLVLTDGSGYELGEAQNPIPQLEVPIWMVHLGGRYPIGYTDEQLAAVQASGGGTAGSVQEALQRLLAGPGVDIVDGYVWAMHEAVPAGALAHQPTDPFAALAARRVILAEMAANRQTLDQLDTLDALHTLSVDQGIVTPYSSMIVLVTEAQERQLDRLENQADRFDREFEAIGDTLAPVPITGVPEPYEWLLIALALGMLGWLFRRQIRDQRLETGD